MKTKNYCKMIILIILALSFFIRPGFAVDGVVSGAFYKGNINYEQGNYGEAVKQYDSILKSGFENGPLYYNLGNSYFKKGALGLAILSYEKARRFIPSDKDLESNYEYACSLIKGAVALNKKTWLANTLDRIFEKFTIDGVTIFLSLFYVFILCGILAGFFFKPFKKHALILIVVLSVFFIAGFTGLSEKISRLHKEAIVVVEQVDAKFEPMDKATVHFTLYEGMKVEVVSSKDNWRKVRRQDNKTGWVENSALANI